MASWCLVSRPGRLLLCLAASVFLLRAAEPPAHPADLKRPMAERSPLIVGVTTDSFPYGFIDEQGRPGGFSADVLDACARVMNLKIERVAAPGRELLERFRLGEFDLLQILSQTPDRDSFADFSVPFLTLQGTIFVQRSDSPIRQLSDFNGRRFAIIGAHSIGEKFLRDHDLHVDPIVVSSSEEALRLLDEGKVAGTFISQLTALSVIERSNIRNVAMFGEPFNDYDIRHCYVVHKGDAVLLARLNEGLAILRRTGEFDRIYRKWFGRLDSPLITRERVIYYAAGLLALGLLATFAAYLRQRNLRRRIALQAAELTSQQTLLRALYDNLPIAICVLEEVETDSYQVLIFNRQAEATLGVDARAAAGRRLGDLPLDLQLAGLLDGMLRQGRTGTGLRRAEMKLTAARKHLVVMLVPLERGPGGRARYCLLADDTTERRNLDEEVAQSRKLRAVGELVGGIAHEFNNLLTPIMLKVGEIQADWPDDPRLGDAVGLIARTVQRAAELTRRLLTFGRKTEPNLEEVRLPAVVDSCFALLRLTVDRRIQWVNSVPAHLPPLYLNGTDLNQILVNLIINARDTLMDKMATAGSSNWTPTIQVEAMRLPADAVRAMPDAAAARVQGWVRLTVRDNGMGIAPEVQERIFEPFFTTKDVGKGTGLGLATVWHLVHVADGRIEVDSTPGEGTSFHLFLPVVPVPVATKPAERPAETPARPARIFIAEDDDLVAQTITSVLQRDGHTIHREPDGAAAWRTLETDPNRFDLLVLDVNMPGMSGIDLVQRVRSAGHYRGRIIIVSGRLTSDELERLDAAQVTSILNKPFEIMEFLATVRRCLLPPT
ncbi:MAG TPA: transporter substrate-binding domain-containing protein [Lacunisphaera sp.]|nr:transporter substrate-binding domain-containing protein [Lacunisphaera sp.]